MGEERMRVSIRIPSRAIAAGLVPLLMLPFAEVSRAQAQQTAGAAQQLQDAPAAQTQVAPEKLTQAQLAQNQEPALATRDQSPQAATPQSSSDPSQSGTGKPVGTAAAPAEKSAGITASRPAGAVIAPAKQRRARSLVIRLAVVAGAAVAVGVVVGLSKASPSRPN
jgi:hypothetical protein